MCRVGAALARHVGQPPVIGEIAAGLVLGPSVLGGIAPGLMNRVLSVSLVEQLDVLATIGVALFAFALGLDLDLSRLQRHSKAVVWVSHASIAVPFVSGCFLAAALKGPLGPRGSYTAFCLFIGAAMSVTAFPVLARILRDNGLIDTTVGQLSLACAAVDDVSAWVGLSVVAAVAQGNGPDDTMRMVVAGALLVFVVLAVVRPLFRAADADGRVASVAVPAAVAFLTAGVSDLIGLHAVFGAFLAGCAMPRRRGLAVELERLAPLTETVLLPLFFATAALDVDLRRIVTHPNELLAAALIIAVAVVGKIGTAYLVASRTGCTKRDAFALGILVNTRGLTELIVLRIGVELGVLAPQLYTLLVLMAVVTTMLTSPLLRLVGVVPAVRARTHVAGAVREVLIGRRRVPRPVL